ncbi:MAG: hypothetical protein HPY85_06810 [Anaerolineae bacterium]|nr:hypothetical protein [Anaerolineae bacterium]
MQEQLLPLDEIEGEGLDYHEVRQISEAAMQALEKRLSDSAQNDATFSRIYWILRDNGYSWRKCAWVAWESLPPMLREPKTKEQFAIDVLGLTSARVLYTWETKHPELKTVIERMRVNPLLSALPEIWNAFLKVATTADYKSIPAYRMAFEMAGLLRDETVIRHVHDGDLDLKEMTYEEILQLEERLRSQKSQLNSVIEAELRPTSDDEGVGMGGGHG